MKINDLVIVATRNTPGRSMNWWALLRGMRGEDQRSGDRCYAEYAGKIDELVGAAAGDA